MWWWVYRRDHRVCQTTIPYLSFGITEYDCLCDGECNKRSQSVSNFNSYLSFGITEYDCLCDGECIIKFTECVKLPFLTFLMILQNITACVMVSVSYRSQSVSNYHSLSFFWYYRIWLPVWWWVYQNHRVCQTSIPYLSFGITEYDCLCDGERIIEITECVKLPFFSLHGNKELFDTFQCQFITVSKEW